MSANKMREAAEAVDRGEVPETPEMRAASNRILAAVRQFCAQLVKHGEDPDMVFSSLMTEGERFAIFVGMPVEDFCELARATHGWVAQDQARAGATSPGGSA